MRILLVAALLCGSAFATGAARAAPPQALERRTSAVMSVQYSEPGWREREEWRRRQELRRRHEVRREERERYEYGYGRPPPPPPLPYYGGPPRY